MTQRCHRQCVYSQQRHLAKLKKRDKGHWYGLGSQAAQNVIERLDRSYQRLFAGEGGRPGFKKRLHRRVMPWEWISD